MYAYSVEDFKDKVDSMYRLVICAARRATQLSKPEARPLVEASSKKPTVGALEEIMQGMVECREASDDDEVED